MGIRWLRWTVGQCALLLCGLVVMGMTGCRHDPMFNADANDGGLADVMFDLLRGLLAAFVI